ncbi:synaptopodin 2b isoform X2 [Stigmatopora nigra]
MEVETDNPDNMGPSGPWSVSDGSNESGILESPEESDDEIHSKSKRHDLERGQMPRPLTHSSSSFLGHGPEMPLTTEPLCASCRQGQGTGNRRVESSEGGSAEVPPATLIFGISVESAEQAERWKSEFDTDLCREDSHGEKCTCIDEDESQSQRQVNENKSKCKRIAHLLTAAPDPQNKGAVLFKKCQQRVKKYTLVSYGTSDSKFDSQKELEEEASEFQEPELDFVRTSDPDFGEEYTIYHRQHDSSVNWGGVQEMEVFSGTEGKGALMFAHRRKHMQGVDSEREWHNKALYLKAPSEPGFPVASNIYKAKKMSNLSEQVNYMDRHIDQTNHPRSAVSNRTAKPFLGGQPGLSSHRMPASPIFSVRNKAVSTYKVPVPIISNPHAWSPTGDIIASRDERITVPAIRACNLPESRRKSTNKHYQTTQKQESDSRESTSYIEAEEDCFSLGAEACNFMQPRAVKLKNPPPVAPKPAINPKSPPWLRGPPNNPCLPLRTSQHEQVSGPQRHHRYTDQNCSQTKKTADSSERDPAQATIQSPAFGRVSLSSSFQPRIQAPTTNWSKPRPRTAVSLQTSCPSFSPHHSQSTLQSRQESISSSIASSPPKPMKSFISNMSLPHPKVFGGGFDRPAGDRTIEGEGQELFSKRASRKDKFVVGTPTTNQGKGRSRSLSLPRHSSSSGHLSPMSTQTPHQCISLAKPTRASNVTPYKPPTPWEVASQSPYGLVDDAFTYQNVSRVRATGSRRSLSEPRKDWKCRLSLDPLASQGQCRMVPAYMTSTSMRMKSAYDEITTAYGPPFRPAQPLKPAGKPRII